MILITARQNSKYSIDQNHSKSSCRQRYQPESLCFLLSVDGTSYIISYVENRIPLVEKRISLVENIISLVENINSLVENIISLVENLITLVEKRIPQRFLKT